MRNDPPYWILFIGIGLLVLVQVSHIIVKIADADLRDPSHPRAQYYSQTAWDDCGAMMADAKRRGFEYWTCHDPAKQQH